MIRLIRSFFALSARERLPHLHQSLSERYDPLSLDPEIEQVLMTGLVRDPAAARALMERYDVLTARELLMQLPPVRANWRLRVRNWIRFLEGSYTSDPHMNEFRQAPQEDIWN